MRTVSLIEGDGIGPEIAAATVRAVEAAGGKLTWERVDAGAGASAAAGHASRARMAKADVNTGLVRDINAPPGRST